MFKKLFEPTTKDICPNCGQTCSTTDVLCPHCGKNLDELFEKLPDIEVSPLTVTKLVKGLFIILVGILIPFACAQSATFIFSTYGSLSGNGSFIRWHSLGSPPEKVTKMLGICDGAICVQTDNKKTYKSGVHDCDEISSSCWEQVEQPLVEEPHFGSCWFKFAEKHPPKRAIQIIKTNACGSGGAIQTNYALLEDGNIWVWEHSVSDLDGLGWFILSFPVAIIAFIVGVVLAAIYMPLIWKKWITAIP